MARDWIRFNTGFEVVGGYLVNIKLGRSFVIHQTDMFGSHPSAMPIKRLD